MKISELFPIVVSRLPGPPVCSLFEAVREVQGIIVNRLLAQKATILIKGIDAELEFLPGDTGMPLPGDFLSLAGRPFVVGEKPLSPLPATNSARLAATGKPLFFDLAARTLRVYPSPDTALTVRLSYYYRPRILTTMEEDLPFWGEFDSVFIEGCTGLIVQGLGVVGDRAFVAVVQSQVDTLLHDKELIAEQLLADDINDV